MAIIFTILMAITLKRNAREKRILAFMDEARNEQPSPGDVLKTAPEE
jgi:hypothetical protein